MNKNDFAPRAPMGWNSYDYFDTTVTEADVLANAEVLAERFKDAGYEYVVIDIEWYANDAGTKRNDWQYIPFGDNEMDAYGRFQPAPARFPSSAGGKGFGPLAEKIHAMGLKFGVHIMRGMPREAAHSRCPIYQSQFTCDQAADAWSICPWNPDMYGIKPTEAGQAYYDALIAMYADWGVDFIKCDDICDSRLYPTGGNVQVFSGWEETRMIHKAIMKTGRPIVLSLSPGPAHVDRAWEYAQNANMWRITDDFWDNWELLKVMFWRCETWEGRVGRGCYPDCDMLPVGKLGKGFGEERTCAMTPDEQRTMMTLWSLFGSPLMIGTTLTDLDDATYALLTNRRIVGLLDGKHTGVQLLRSDEEAVWKSTDPASGDVVYGLFNLTDEAREVRAEIEEDGIRAWKDLWSGDAVFPQNGMIGGVIPPHGVLAVGCE